MSNPDKSREVEADASLLASQLVYHLRCLVEDATDPDLPRAERLALVRKRARRIREIRRETPATVGGRRGGTRPRS